MPRATNQSKMAHIRLEEPIMNALRERAKACGMSVAELHRFALRRVLGMIDGTPIDYSQASFHQLIQLTALGDLIACRMMRDSYVAMAREAEASGLVNRACEFLCAASQFGGLAMNMGSATDEMEFALIGLSRARLGRIRGEPHEIEFADMAEAELMARLDRLADAGLSDAHDYLQAAAVVVPSHILKQAAERRVRERE